MRKKIRLIFKDNEAKLYEVVGETYDAANFTYNVYKIQKSGSWVSCATPYVCDRSIEDIVTHLESHGFIHKIGLYNQKLSEMEDHQ
jgi:hypothetical protein